MDPLKNKYWTQKACAKRRGISFLLSYDDWWNIWQQSGKWNQRGCKKGQYVMSRYNDTGSYEVENVFIQQHGINIAEAQTGRIRSDFSAIMKNKWDLYRTQTQQKENIR
jgi:hypothetical protein